MLLTGRGNLWPRQCCVLLMASHPVGRARLPLHAPQGPGCVAPSDPGAVRCSDLALHLLCIMGPAVPPAPSWYSCHDLSLANGTCLSVVTPMIVACCGHVHACFLPRAPGTSVYQIAFVSISETCSHALHRSLASLVLSRGIRSFSPHHCIGTSCLCRCRVCIVLPRLRALCPCVCQTCRSFCAPDAVQTCSVLLVPIRCLGALAAMCFSDADLFTYVRTVSTRTF